MPPDLQTKEKTARMGVQATEGYAYCTDRNPKGMISLDRYHGHNRRKTSPALEFDRTLLLFGFTLELLQVALTNVTMEIVGVPDEKHLPPNEVLQDGSANPNRETTDRQAYHRVVDDGVAPVRRADVRAARPERAARKPDLVQDGADVVLGRRRGEVRAADLGHVRDLSVTCVIISMAHEQMGVRDARRSRC